MTAHKVRIRPRIFLYLEQLEARELLNGSFEGLDTAPLVNDLTRLHNDMATSGFAVVNAVQAAPTNPTPLALLYNQ